MHGCIYCIDLFPRWWLLSTVHQLASIVAAVASFMPASLWRGALLFRPRRNARSPGRGCSNIASQNNCVLHSLMIAKARLDS
jgi:hypothetical protein